MQLSLFDTTRRHWTWLRGAIERHCQRAHELSTPNRKGGMAKGHAVEDGDEAARRKIVALPPCAASTGALLALGSSRRLRC